MSKKNTRNQNQPTPQSQPQGQAPQVNETIVEGNQGAAEPKTKKGSAKKTDTWFGNQDTDKKHNLSALKIPQDHFVVRHFNNITLQNGQQIEDHTSSRFQVYDTETFKNLNTQPVKEGKQMPSKFQEMGLNVDVLHDPTNE